MIEAVRFRLDRPNVNCRQCQINFAEDGIESDCGGCPEHERDQLTIQLLAAYSLATPDGELDQAAVAQALEDLEINPADHRLARRCLAAIHAQVLEHRAESVKEVRGEA